MESVLYATLFREEELTDLHPSSSSTRLMTLRPALTFIRFWSWHMRTEHCHTGRY